MTNRTVASYEVQATFSVGHNSRDVADIPETVEKEFGPDEFSAAAEYYISVTRYFQDAKRFNPKMSDVIIDVAFWLHRIDRTPMHLGFFVI